MAARTTVAPPGELVDILPHCSPRTRRNWYRLPVVVRQGMRKSATFVVGMEGRFTQKSLT